MTTTQPTESISGQVEAWVRLPAATLAATIDLLHRLDVFFREHADSTVHTQLSLFCAATGSHPICGAPALLDELGLRALMLRTAMTAAGTDHDHADE
ncbi:hypothetical protein [Paractinoplanes hotanensis]|uniref:Uncharacterized protein n=1 Tax=Paractinoplanes hotanensis TaxID=2906497 RepID=A0ABT0YHK5_9ACTN|nr:hypothetical protein [Actinoplanes hotanensis]MCM4085205.1 hypothetical protein [Actinoplanes hotanensis]MDY7090957.1 hypothetical protein [Actinomycetota bacterium]